MPGPHGAPGQTPAPSPPPTHRPAPAHREPLPRREVVSFVRRSTRMNTSQQRAWQTHGPKWMIPFAHRDLHTSVAPGQELDVATIWGREAPLWIEIGTGNGEACAAIAKAHPEVNFLAFEVFLPSVASALGLLAREGVDNVRFAEVDAIDALRHAIAPATVQRLFTFFPDPWHKKRHHKRRLVGTDFASLVTAKLAPGGVWRLATDWEDYALWMREHLDHHPGLVNVHDGWAPRLAERPVTKYEAKGLAAGRTVHDLTYRRADAPQD